MVPARLVEFVVCPLCYGKLRINQDFSKLRCVECGKRYRICDEIPILLPQEAAEELNLSGNLTDL